MASLEDQIRAQWGQYGDWQSADQNQAADLARLLEANGITDLSKLGLSKKTVEVGPQTGALVGYVGDQEQYADLDARSFDAPVFEYDGRQLGFLGDVNQDGSLARIGERDYLGFDTRDQGLARGNLAGFSSRGGGHTNFQLVPTEDGGFAIAPVWESSKADDLYNTKMAALFAAGGYGAALGAGGATGIAASAGSGAAAGAATGYGSAVLTGADPLKAGYGGLVTGAITGGVKGLGQSQGWSPATTRAVTGGGNALLRGGDAEDALRGAATGYIAGGGANGLLSGSDIGSGNVDNFNFDDWDFGGTSDNYFGDSFGNSSIDFASEFDPSLYDFGTGSFDFSKVLPTLLKLGGAAAGAASSQDQQKTSSVEPWKEAQPFLKDLLAQGQSLSKQYQAQPFNQAQKTGLSNMGQLYDFVNQNAGGLLMGPHANANGANQFIRGAPQRSLLGTGPAVGTWTPGSYGNFLG